MIVFVQALTGKVALRILQLHGNQLFLQYSFFIGSVRSLLRPQGKLILHLARDPVLRAIKLGRVRHVRAAIAIQQRNHQGIFQLAARRKRKPFAPADDEWRLRHRFHSAGQDNISFAKLNHLRRIHDRLHAASAQTIHCQCGSFNGQPGPQRHMTRTVERISRGLLRVSKYSVIKLPRIQSGTFNRALPRNRAEFLRSEVLQLSAIATKGGSRAADHCNITRF